MRDEPDIDVVTVKRSGGRETEAHLMTAHGLAVMIQDDGSIIIEAYPANARANGLRLYVGGESAAAMAPQWQRWSRLVDWIKRKDKG
jgi:hypothetical protein